MKKRFDDHFIPTCNTKIIWVSEIQLASTCKKMVRQTLQLQRSAWQPFRAGQNRVWCMRFSPIWAMQLDSKLILYNYNSFSHSRNVPQRSGEIPTKRAQGHTTDHWSSWEQQIRQRLNMSQCSKTPLMIDNNVLHEPCTVCRKWTIPSGMQIPGKCQWSLSQWNWAMKTLHSWELWMARNSPQNNGKWPYKKVNGQPVK